MTNTDFIKAGSITGVTFQGTNNAGGGFITHTYSTPFPSGITPIVVAVGNVNNGYTASVMITNSTNTSFTFLARSGYSSDATGRIVHYVAVNPAALAISNN